MCARLEVNLGLKFFSCLFVCLCRVARVHLHLDGRDGDFVPLTC